MNVFVRFISRLLLPVGIFFLIPAVALAASAGFVPSTGIWFSSTTITPGELVRVYAVVVNDEYFALDGVVGFYDNVALIDTAQFNALEKESAWQLKVLWQPSPGNHTVRAAFISAVAIDSQGRRTAVPVAELTQVQGTASASVSSVQNKQNSEASSSPLTQPNTPSAPNEAQPPAPSTFAPAAAQVAVVKENNTLLIRTIEQPPAPNPNSLSGLAQSAGGFMSSVQNVYDQNRAALDKAQATLATITSTVGKISNAYASAQVAAQKGQEYYTKTKSTVGVVQDTLQNVAPYLAPLKRAWLIVSHNNEPKRVAIIIGILLFILLLWKLRRGRFREDFDR